MRGAPRSVEPFAARDVVELGFIAVAPPTPPALPAAAVERLPCGELGIPDLDEDPFWRLVAAFLVECRRPQTRRAYFTDLKAWYAWCVARDRHPLDARRCTVMWTAPPGASFIVRVRVRSGRRPRDQQIADCPSQDDADHGRRPADNRVPDACSSDTYCSGARSSHQLLRRRRPPGPTPRA